MTTPEKVVTRRNQLCTGTDQPLATRLAADNMVVSTCETCDARRSVEGPGESRRPPNRLRWTLGGKSVNSASRAATRSLRDAKNAPIRTVAWTAKIDADSQGTPPKYICRKSPLMSVAKSSSG